MFYWYPLFEHNGLPWFPWVSGFPGGSVAKESAWNEGDLGSVPGLGRSPGEGKGYPLQYSGLENSMGSQRVGHDWATFTFSFSQGINVPSPCLFIFLFISSMGSWTPVAFMSCYMSLSLFILMLKLSHLWSLGATTSWFLYLFDMPCILSTFPCFMANQDNLQSSLFLS